MTDQSDPSPTPPPYDYTNDYTEETSLSQQAMTNHAKTYLERGVEYGVRAIKLNTSFTAKYTVFNTF